MAAFLDVCRFSPTLGGTTDWTVSAAVTGYQTPASAGAVNGTIYRYRAESADLTQWEVGYGAYTVSGTVLARTTVLFNSAGTTAKISFTVAPQVAVVALKEDLLSIEEANSFTAAQQDQARANLAIMGRNKIINGGFTINQRVYVSAAALASGVYGHDRWRAGASGGDYSFTQLASPTTITIAASKSLIQVIEDKNVEGGTFTLSWTGTATARVTVNSATPSGNFAVSPITIAGQTAGTTMSVEFTGANAAGTAAVATNTGTLGPVQLEQSNKATPFEFRPYALEMHLCQRYCWMWQGAAAAQRLGTVVADTTTSGQMVLNLPVHLRASPTLTMSGVTVNAAAGSSPTVYGGYTAPAGNVLSVGLTLSGVTAGTTYQAFSAAGAGSFKVDAEL